MHTGRMPPEIGASNGVMIPQTKGHPRLPAICQKLRQRHQTDSPSLTSSFLSCEAIRFHCLSPRPYSILLGQPQGTNMASRLSAVCPGPCGSVTHLDLCSTGHTTDGLPGDLCPLCKSPAQSNAPLMFTLMRSARLRVVSSRRMDTDGIKSCFHPFCPFFLFVD